MATDTKEQVKELLAKNKSAKEIAEALDKTPATIYNHIANIRKESGDTTPRKRGRPPKVATEGDAPKEEATPAAARPRPGKAAPVKTEAKQTVTPTAKSNGHDTSRFPVIRAAIEQELSEARSKVVVLEKMLEAV
jgi:hypothetical protein